MQVFNEDGYNHYKVKSAEIPFRPAWFKIYQTFRYRIEPQLQFV